jgi:hypothetical protein
MIAAEPIVARRCGADGWPEPVRAPCLNSGCLPLLPQQRFIRRMTMTHARPDVPQPDPIVHDQPGDVPQVPCAEELDEHKPGSPYGNQTVVDADSPQPA